MFPRAGTFRRPGASAVEMRLFRRPGRLDAVMWTGFAIAAVGLLWSFWPSPGIDHDYFARISSTYGRRGPTVMIDEAHWNADRADGRYRPFVHLLRRDGYRVVRNKQEFVPGLFAGIHVLVIANALGFQGTLQRFANCRRFRGQGAPGGGRVRSRRSGRCARLGALGWIAVAGGGSCALWIGGAEDGRSFRRRDERLESGPIASPQPGSNAEEVWRTTPLSKAVRTATSRFIRW